jgi:hypothetical protein
VAVNPTVRIACLKSLRIGSVQFASNSTHIKIASIAAAGASQSEDRNDKQKTGFFDSIDPERKSIQSLAPVAVPSMPGKKTPIRLIGK